MRIIDHDQRLMLGCHFDDLREWCNLAVHAEDSVARQAQAREGRLLCCERLGELLKYYDREAA
jgi:hypothetical protein